MSNLTYSALTNGVWILTNCQVDKLQKIECVFYGVRNFWQGSVCIKEQGRGCGNK